MTGRGAVSYAAPGRGKSRATAKENDVTVSMIRFGARAGALVCVLAGAFALMPELAAQDMMRGLDSLRRNIRRRT